MRLATVCWFFLLTWPHAAGFAIGPRFDRHHHFVGNTLRGEASPPYQYFTIRLFCLKAESSGNWDPSNAPKLDFNECYYDVLEVKLYLDDLKQLKKAFHKVAFRFHPDSKQTSEEKELANQQMMVINNAYKILKEPSLKRQYDLRRQQGLRGAQANVKGAMRNDPHFDAPEVKSETQRRSPSRSSRSKTTEYEEDEEVDPDETYYERRQRQQYKKQSIYNSQRYSSTAIDAENNLYEEIFDELKKQQYAAQESSRRSRNGAYFDSSTGEIRTDDDFGDKKYENYFQRNSRSSDFYDSTRESAYSSGEAVQSIPQLKKLLKQLRKEKDQKEDRLLEDERDWGEVRDQQQIEKRLRDIQQLRRLVDQIVDIESEIQFAEYSQRELRRQSGRYSDMYKRYKGIRDDFYASDFDRDDVNSSGGGIFDALFGGDEQFLDDFGPTKGPYSSPAEDEYLSRSTRDRPWRRGWGIRNRPRSEGDHSKDRDSGLDGGGNSHRRVRHRPRR